MSFGLHIYIGLSTTYTYRFGRTIQQIPIPTDGRHFNFNLFSPFLFQRRLNTIIDYDVVLVMDKGKVVEFGPPKTLLANEDGIFTAMVNATGPESAAALKEMAR